MQDFSILIATVNGSGSQSANSILLRTLFRMGVQVGGKNLFPSNIQGLPTWFTIRICDQGFVGRKKGNEIVVALNQSTLAQDLSQVNPRGYFFYEENLDLPDPLPRSEIQLIALPLKRLADGTTDSIKLRKLLINMVYLGVLARLLGLNKVVLQQTIADHFKDKESVILANQKAIDAGYDYAATDLQDLKFEFEVREPLRRDSKQLLIDGNTATGLGFAFGGCHFVAWYPITPSSSVVESFERFAGVYRRDSEGKLHAAVVQAEDELSAISMVIGAGWTGARAMTATSGPGLSLMAEAAGLAYFAEIPAVIWDVQRVGPSTGLPTRTQQGDLISAYQLSHGDTQHIVLLPGNVNECFEFAQSSLDLAERFQTLVIGLSDLDLGMNYHMGEPFELGQKFDRGKVLGLNDSAALESFARYRDVDDDGICYRTLPGTANNKAAFFTRGTGHTETSSYSEDPLVFSQKLLRLRKKIDLARKEAPQPILRQQGVSKSLALMYYGSTSMVIPEVRSLLLNTGHEASELRVRALPLSLKVKEFIEEHQTIFIIEQNRDGQLAQILCNDYPELAGRLKRINIFDGLPLVATEVAGLIQAQLQKDQTMTEASL